MRKLRVIKEKCKVEKVAKDGHIEYEERFEFIPQYFNVEMNRWMYCSLDNYLVARHYYELEKAVDVCKKFAEMHPEPDVVWTNEI